VAWLLYYGEWPRHDIDHIDMNKLNNKIDNLRECSGKIVNSHNAPLPLNNTSGYHGVTLHKKTGKWMAQIKINRKNTYIGLFAKPEDAHNAYCSAKAVLHPASKYGSAQ
jgi:hypothetical protein